MAIVLVKDSSATRDSSDKRLGRIADHRWRCERAVRPSEGIPNGGAHVLAVWATPGQLDHFVAPALQQHGEQSAVRKGRHELFHNVVFLCCLSEDDVIYVVG